MNEDIKESTLLIELDTILDTRIGTLLTHFGQEATLKALNSKYHERIADVFPTVSWDEFNKVYINRDRRVLKNSMRTPIFNIIKDFILGTLQNAMSTPFVMFPHIVINMYPYELTEDEQILIHEIVKTYVIESAEVSITSLSYEELTPSLINDNFSLMVMYDANKWLDVQTQLGHIKKVGCPTVGLFTPMMFKKFPLSNEEKAAIKNSNESIFDAISRDLLPFIRLVYLPVKHFSLDVKLPT